MDAFLTKLFGPKSDAKSPFEELDFLVVDEMGDPKNGFQIGGLTNDPKWL